MTFHMCRLTFFFIGQVPHRIFVVVMYYVLSDFFSNPLKFTRKANCSSQFNRKILGKDMEW